MIEQLRQLSDLSVYEPSVSETDGVTYFMARRGSEKLIGSAGGGNISGDVVSPPHQDSPIIVGPIDHTNAVRIRQALPWTAPKVIGLQTSAGLGDRLGLATPGHVRAVRGSGVIPFFAQQSIREMVRTARTPEEVIDCATWGVLQEGYREGFGSDADHLQRLEDIDTTVAAGFTMFTIDPGEHVADNADNLDPPALAEKYAALDFETLQRSPGELKNAYVGESFDLCDGSRVKFDDESFLRAAVKYGNAIAHTVRMYHHLTDAASGEFELEVSVDETESPTSPAEHYFFAAELKRLAVEWVSMAPRFVGRFEKGVDYIGDTDEFAKSFAQHVAVMRTLGPYKISIHSGSDKFSIYPIVSELTGGMVHLKTAGTSYLSAVRAIAVIDPPLFRAILDFARERYETDKATYHVSGNLSKVPTANDVKDGDLAPLVDEFNARQVLHVTFGSVLTVDGGQRFRTRILAALKTAEETHYDALEQHLRRHIAPFAK
jgi:hypothetical protein